MQKLIVYERGTGAIIGYGTVVVLANGKMFEPVLFDLAGEGLPAGWYDLQVTDEKYYVVVPMEIQ